MTEPEKLLLAVTIEHAAAALEISPRQVRYLVSRGELAPVLRIGRSVRIPVSTLRDYAEKRTADVSPTPAVLGSGNGRPTRLRTG